MKRKTIYYSDELHDDFGTTVKKIRPLPKDYKFVKNNVFSKIFTFILYQLIVKPLAWLYMKIKFGLQIKNKSVLKMHSGGYFLFGNHVTIMGDAFIPNLLAFNKKNYIITGEQANSLTAILPILRAVGSIPLTDNMSQNIKLLKCVKQRITEGASVTVFPEAHVWPYYTDIRPFKEISFKYAVITAAPIFTFTTCFQKKKIGSRPKIVVYVDGPFYPKKGEDAQTQAKILRDQAFETMKKRATENSTYSFFDYRKKQD